MSIFDDLTSDDVDDLRDGYNRMSNTRFGNPEMFVAELLAFRKLCQFLQIPSGEFEFQAQKYRAMSFHDAARIVNHKHLHATA